MVPKERAYLQSAREHSMQPQKKHFTLKGSARASKKLALANATKGTIDDGSDDRRLLIGFEW